MGKSPPTTQDPFSDQPHVIVTLIDGRNKLSSDIIKLSHVAPKAKVQVIVGSTNPGAAVILG